MNLNCIATRFLSLFLLFTSMALAQTTAPNALVTDSLNVIERESPRFDAFLSRLDRLYNCGNDRLNVVHFGGSHIQADVWSNVLRDSLQTEAAPGARGIVFPFAAAGTNAPYSYEVKHTGTWQGHRSAYNKHQERWGVLGITATTTDTLATLKFTFESAARPVVVRELLILSNADSAGYFLEFSPPAQVHSSQLLEGGYRRVRFVANVDSIELVFRRKGENLMPLRFYGIVLENDRPGVAYHSIGANGSRFVSYQRCALFQQQLNLLKPDLAIVTIGTNDSSEPDYDSAVYEKNYEAFIGQLRVANPACALILTVPNDSYVRSKIHNDNLASVRRVIHRLAAKHDAVVWDFYSIMGGATSAKRWRDAALMKPDLVHFTKEGYLLKGRLLTAALKARYLHWHEMQPPAWKN